MDRNVLTREGQRTESIAKIPDDLLGCAGSIDLDFEAHHFNELDARYVCSVDETAYHDPYFSRKWIIISFYVYIFF